MVDKKRKILEKVLAGTKNIRFNEMVTLIEAFGFSLARINGSHHIFTHPEVREIVNIQNKKGEVTSYQVRQFLSLIEEYNLSIEEDES
ncbi:type II toxin-antitoxin system HicA family toxin [Aerosakkonemataceae cyanobacterium BLCC-F154]|uniref:Type II toxin-antitoxin system HicA family toxin n=1 Tax=Floridaenema fluviatile BLCC-F154 TaxID=3153640 RepID=A0ABV4YD58_9CYAN